MMSYQRIIEFGPYRLLPETRLLLHDGAPVKIGGRALDILLVLAERPGEIISHREIMARVWPNLTIEDSGLRVQMAALRKVIGDTSPPHRLVVNVVGLGYALLASATTTQGRFGGQDRSVAQVALPKRAGTTVGRSSDLQKVSENLRSSRFVTIHGPGGIGKTTLAIDIATAEAAAFADGVRFVDLGLVSAEGSVAGAVAVALGLAVQRPDPTRSIFEYLATRSLLLVLDCCEHVVDAAAALAEQMIERTPGICILATSREPLRAAGEVVYRLGPLSVPPDGARLRAADLAAYSAPQLFVERAVALGLPAPLSDEDVNLCAVICRRVDGIALALELAAGRAATHGLRQTADQLRDHVQLNWKGRRTAPARHQTLSAMLAWSYDLIAEGERALLASLSVFMGWFTLDDAAAMAAVADREEFVESLAQLVSKSLVAVETGGARVRYRLLDATRAYVQRKLAAQDVAALRRRHAEHYLRATGGREAAAPERHLSTDLLANIRAALTGAFSEKGDDNVAVNLAANSADLFLQRGMVEEALSSAARALAALPRTEAGPRAEMKLRVALAHATMYVNGTPDRVENVMLGAVDACEAAGALAEKFTLLCSLHMFRRSRGQLDTLLPIAQEAAKVAARLKNPAATVVSGIMTGLSHQMLGNLAEALASLSPVRRHEVHRDPALRHFHRFHPPADIVYARTKWLLGYPDQAPAAIVAADDIRPDDDPAIACHLLFWGVRVFYWLGEWDSVDLWAERMIDLSAAHGFLPHLWFGQALRAEVAIRSGDRRSGISILRNAIARLEAPEVGIRTPWLNACLAEALGAEGLVDQGLALIEDFDPDPGQRYDAFRPEILRVHGQLLAQAGDPAAAERLLRLAVAMARAHDALSWQLKAATTLAELLLATGRGSDARALLSQVHARFTEGFGTADLRRAQDLLDKIDG